MLILKNIVKDYVTGDTTVTALKEVNINFRENEFVSILGPSGCGKTTMLNLIGGLDRYTSGDLIINGKSTKTFTDENWDTYRNHSVGFVFQSYNLIPHQSVLSNVELALTLSGVSKKERHERAVKALEQVGLGDQLHKRPSQMSGGQMQRVAIARALINNPSILLADEPTGALDSETSVQIMELLREISKDKLIIMVTHNPELADQYSSRIIRCLDGKVIDDSNPFNPTGVDFKAEEDKAKEEKAKGKKPSMSFTTAFSLSIRNLSTKKARTFLTAFAGSIGIIGIALVLALSTGIQNYVDKVQNDTLLSFPMSIERESVNMDGMMNTVMGMNPLEDVTHDLDQVYVNQSFTELVNSFIAQSNSNNLKSFKTYVDQNHDAFFDICNDIQFKYTTPLNIFCADTSEKLTQVNPSTLMDSFQTASPLGDMQSMLGTSFNVWLELIGGQEVINNQYDVVYGNLPQNYNEVVLMLDKNNEINELVLYALGLKDQSQFMANIMASLANGEQVDSSVNDTYTYDEIMQMPFKLVLNSDYMVKDSKTGLWKDLSGNPAYLKTVVDNGLDLKIVGVLRPKEDNVIAVGTGGIGYMTELVDYALEKTAQSEVVKEQLANPTVDVITGLTFNTLTVNDFDLADVDMGKINFDFLNLAPFMSLTAGVDIENIDIMNMDIAELFGFDNMTGLQKKLMEGFLNDEQVLALKQAYVDSVNDECSYAKTMETIGYATPDSPSSIYFYPKSFDDKDELNKMINYYNAQVEADGHSENKIAVTDLIGAIMGSVNNIISIVTYVLIVFVAISLVVSSIMIGIITYISVLERTKEIGILRSIGASKRDISQVFNAETFTIGLCAGIIGIVSTLILQVPINILLDYWTNTGAKADLPFISALILIAISVALTFVAGLIPSSLAAKKDPVEALRTD